MTTRHKENIVLARVAESWHSVEWQDRFMALLPDFPSRRQRQSWEYSWHVLLAFLHANGNGRGLVERSDEELLAIPGFGIKTLTKLDLVLGNVASNLNRRV